MASGEQIIVGFAEDLGKLLGTAQAKADGWLGQRKEIAKTLAGIRDTATKLLTQIGEETRSIIGPRRGRPPGSGKPGPGGPAGRKRRKMSAAARARISAAQKKRWAAQKGERKGSSPE